jgi:hypothetical protein
MVGDPLCPSCRHYRTEGYTHEMPGGCRHVVRVVYRCAVFGLVLVPDDCPRYEEKEAEA